MWRRKHMPMGTLYQEATLHGKRALVWQDHSGWNVHCNGSTVRKLATAAKAKAAARRLSQKEK